MLNDQLSWTRLSSSALTHGLSQIKSLNHRIIKVEKTSKIIKSNYLPNTTMHTKPCPEVPHLHIF